MAEGLRVDLVAQAPIALRAQLHVPPGQTLALVGPSGAGKSSLLKAIAGMLPATGQVRVDGAAWQDGTIGLPAWQRRVGLVLQGGGLFPHLDALGNVMIAQERPDRDGARALLAAVQLDGAVLMRRPAQLSGGEQMRVALARALAREPALLLLDEPFAAVDRPVRRALIALVGRLRTVSAAPMIIVTHDLEEAAGIANLAAFMEGGAIVEAGAAADILSKPTSRLNRWLAST